jgi:outer membrane protein TolC
MQWNCLKIFSFLFYFSFSASSLAQTLPSFEQTLEQSQSLAQKNSGSLKSSESSWAEAKSHAQAARSGLFPALNLNGNYYYQTLIPTFSLGANTLDLQYHNNYTVGPEITYTIFDAGQISHQAQSDRTLARAKGEDYKSEARQLTYSVNQAYAAVQLAIKNLDFTAASLRLSQAESHDLDLRFRAGTSSRLDQISAHKETLSYQLRFQSAQTSLGAALKDLFALTGETRNFDTSRPISAQLAQDLPSNVEAPSMTVQVESIDAIVNSFHLNIQKEVPADLPQLKSLSLNAEAAQQSAQSALAAYWPKISVSARAELLYPDVFLNKTAENNIFAVNLSLPIFNAGQTQNRAEEKRSQAHASEYQREQLLLDLKRDYNKARDSLLTLKVQAKIDDQNVNESKEIADLTYRSYRTGTKNFLDVQTVNVQLLEAEVEATRTQQQILNQLATLEALSNQGVD